MLKNAGFLGCIILLTVLVLCADTFQALIQYPDVVTAQAAKMVRVAI